MDNTVTDYAYTSILNMIMSTEIPPGSRIREDLLAEKLGVSRTPVREAINRLTQNGFVISIKRKGLYCVDITLEELLHLLDLRITLESLSFCKCIELATSEDIEGVRSVIHDFNTHYNAIMQDYSEESPNEIALLHNTLDVKFHVQIAQVSHSTRLIKYISEVENCLLLARQRIYRSDESAKIINLSWQQHEGILHAIEKRDNTAAQHMLELHLQLMKDTQVNTYTSER